MHLKINLNKITTHGKAVFLEPSKFQKAFRLNFPEYMLAFFLFAFIAAGLYLISELIIFGQEATPTELLMFSVQLVGLLILISFVMQSLVFATGKILRLQVKFQEFLKYLLFISLIGFCIDRVVFILLLLIQKSPSFESLNLVYMNDLIVLVMALWQILHYRALVAGNKEWKVNIISLLYYLLIIVILGP